MRTRPLISAQTMPIADVTDLVDLIKAPLSHFQALTHTRTLLETEIQAIGNSELFTQAATLNPNLREGLISEG